MAPAILALGAAAFEGLTFAVATIEVAAVDATIGEMA
jgi:hypothetical protein